MVYIYKHISFVVLCVYGVKAKVKVPPGNCLVVHAFSFCYGLWQAMTQLNMTPETEYISERNWYSQTIPETCCVALSLHVLIKIAFD